ncbi:hypothetical protein [Endozoicomonas numazuensis]|uniref:hypothetical protein n=1 Tax=Endozoicomonas numazuensis TaxID=1137799 RepID=UPI000AE2ABE6|nr:hypothetical protein [Endozoicomonas numazuensis]
MITDVIQYVESHPLGTLLITLSLAIFGYLLRVSFFQRQRIRKSLDSISAVFRDDLNALIESDLKTMDILNESSFNKHRSVIRNEIKPLAIHQRIRLSREWKQLAYGNNKEQGKLLRYEQYADCYSISENKKLRNLAVHRINSILKICA